jgi:hypothetical protein
MRARLCKRHLRRTTNSEGDWRGAMDAWKGA